MNILSVDTLVPPRPRDALGEFGIYVHVPFCAHRCWYCDFNAYSGLDHLADRYMEALATDVRSALSAHVDADLAERPRITSIFIGGGTPSLVDARGIAGVLDAAREAWDLAADAEITIECNPESTDANKLESYLRAGANRVSFGVQSTNDELLAFLGRLHDSPTALAALRLAKAVGFSGVNADLIFGIPGEDDDVWRRSLDDVLSCEVTHVSAYALTYEEGTPMHSWRRLGKIVPESDDDAARRWETADDVLSGAGFRRYEISNWSRPGSESAHNSLYWRCGEYLGVGAGAHSHLASRHGSIRSWVVKSPERYIDAVSAGAHPVAGAEMIGQREREAEVLFCGLRRADGVEASSFSALTGRDLASVFGRVLERAADEELLIWDGRTAKLTRRGTLLANEILLRFLA